MKNELLYLLLPPRVTCEIPEVDFYKLYGDVVSMKLVEASFEIIHRAHYVAEGSGYTPECVRQTVAYLVMRDLQKALREEFYSGLIDDLEGKVHGSTMAYLTLYGFVAEGRDTTLPLTRDDEHKIDALLEDFKSHLLNDYSATGSLKGFLAANKRLFDDAMMMVMKATKGKCNPATVATHIERVLGCKPIRPEENRLTL